MSTTYCIIMAGGIGSRFWPLSTEETPKQFLDILGVGKSLLRLTFERLNKICPSENFFVVTNESYAELVLEQIPEFSSEQVLKEPMRRNTAPCIAYGVHEIKKKNPNASIIVAPSDHVILNENEFVSVLETGIDFVSKNDVLLTLGIKPCRPDTGYGYIQIDKVFDFDSRYIINKVKTFTEKPDLELAKVFIDSGEFFWNSGIFFGALNSINDAFKKYLPQVSYLFETELGVSTDKNVLDKVYSACPNISIDYGIMEKSENVYVLQTDFGWSDLGTWGALYDYSTKDKNNNAIIGKSVYIYDSNNNMISVPKGKTVVIDSLNDYIVVDSEDRLLITKRENEQKIRQFVNDIKRYKGEKK